MVRTIYSVLGDLVDDLTSFPGRTGITEPTTVSENIYKNDSEYIIEILVPGLTKEDISVKMEHGAIRVKTLHAPGKESTAFSRIGFSKRPTIDRKYTLPSECSKKGIKARVLNGILEVKIPLEGNSEDIEIM